MNCHLILKNGSQGVERKRWGAMDGICVYLIKAQVNRRLYEASNGIRNRITEENGEEIVQLLNL